MQKLIVATLAFGAFAYLPLTGCHREHTTKRLEIIITPDFSASTATIECVASSTDRCRLIFLGSGSPSELMLHTRASGTVSGISPDTKFCFDVHTIDSAVCSKQTMPPKRGTFTYRVTNSSTDSD